MNTLDLLLKADIPNLPEKEYRQKRLSGLCGGDVIFRLRALPYNRAVEIINSNTDDASIHLVLAGTAEPDLKDAGLLTKYSAVTPAELVKKILLPGEIEDMARAIEKLSGFRETTIEEIKKN